MVRVSYDVAHTSFDGDDDVWSLHGLLAFARERSVVHHHSCKKSDYFGNIMKNLLLYYLEKGGSSELTTPII